MQIYIYTLCVTGYKHRNNGKNINIIIIIIIVIIIIIRLAIGTIGTITALLLLLPLLLLLALCPELQKQAPGGLIGVQRLTRLERTRQQDRCVGVTV